MQAALDSAAHSMMLNRLRERQNFPAALAGGACGALVGAVIWAAAGLATRREFAVMALLVGFLTGAFARRWGQGVDRSFQVAAGALALAGCLTGNILIGLVLMAPHQGVPALGLLLRLRPEGAAWIIRQTFQPIDVLFFGWAVVTAYGAAVVRVASAAKIPPPVH